MSKRFALQKAVVSVLAFILILIVPMVAFAAGLSVTADSDSVKTGDTVKLTIVVSGKHIAVAQGSFKYDPKLLEYISSNGGASDGYIQLVSAQSGGASSLTAVINFKARAAGDAKISVSIESILDYSGNDLGATEDAEVTVSVTASAGTEQSNKPAEQIPAADYSQTGVAAKNVKGAAAQMHIWRSIKNLTMPSGFYDKEITYGGETVGGAAMPDNEDFLLLYLSEKAGENAGYYIYVKTKDELYPYVTVASVQANFTLLWPDDSVKAPEGFEPVMFKWKERDIPAWTAKGSDGTVHLVFARNSSGDTGFYLYNSTDKSVQRYQTYAQTNPVPENDTPSAAVSQGNVPSNTVPESAPASTPVAEQINDSGITISTTLFIVICAAGAVLFSAVLVLTILFISKKTRKNDQNVNI